MQVNLFRSLVQNACLKIRLINTGVISKDETAFKMKNAYKPTTSLIEFYQNRQVVNALNFHPFQTFAVKWIGKNLMRAKINPLLPQNQILQKFSVAV